MSRRIPEILLRNWFLVAALLLASALLIGWAVGFVHFYWGQLPDLHPRPTRPGPHFD